MHRFAVLILCGFTATLAAQQPAPAFEVASVKLWRPPATPATSVVMPAAAPDRFNRRATVAELIAYAFDVRDHQVSGGPDWVRTERYEVAARAGREVSQAELRAMVRTLL